MATKKTPQSDNENLSFFNEEKNLQKAKESQERRKMLKITSLVALGLALPTGFAIYYDKQKTSELNKDYLSTSQQVINSPIMNKLNDYQKIIEQKNIKNNTLMLDMAQFLPLANLFNVNINVANIEKNSKATYENAVLEIYNIKSVFEHFISLKSPEQITEAIDKNYQQSKKELAVVKEFLKDINDPNYLPKGIKELDGVTKIILETTDKLKDIRQEVVSTVEAKIKTGDYNLDSTQNALIDDIKDSTKSQVLDLSKLRAEIANSEFSNDFTNDDLLDAAKSLKELESSIVDKVVSDKQAIVGLIDKVSNGKELQTGDAGTAISSASPIVSSTQQVANNNAPVGQSHWGAFEYYLLYSWLSGGSRTTPGMAASHTSAFAATSGKSLNKTSNGAYIPPVTAKSTAVNSMAAAAVAPSNNLYNTRNPKSYINNSLNSTINTANPTKSPQALRQKFEAVRAKGNMAASNRRASIARAEAKARAASQARANARSSVSVSRGGSASVS